MTGGAGDVPRPGTLEYKILQHLCGNPGCTFRGLLEAIKANKRATIAALQDCHRRGLLVYAGDFDAQRTTLITRPGLGDELAAALEGHVQDCRARDEERRKDKLDRARGGRNQEDGTPTYERRWNRP